jgi:phosphoribosyl-ATP pyrophosphohydrolase
MTDHRLEILAELASEVEARKRASPETSYTARLFSQGIEKCAKKLGEEAIEAALAAVMGDKPHLTAEAADVLYHLLVVLAAADVPLTDVMAELERRKGVSGIAEKASRKQG